MHTRIQHSPSLNAAGARQAGASPNNLRAATLSQPLAALRLQLMALLDQHKKLLGERGTRTVSYGRAALSFMNEGNATLAKIAASKLASGETAAMQKPGIDRRLLHKLGEMAKSAIISYRLARHELCWLREELELATKSPGLGDEALAAIGAMIDEALEMLEHASGALNEVPAELNDLAWRYTRSVARIQRQLAAGG